MWEIKDDSRGVLSKALVHYKGEFYIVSENTGLEETLIFYATCTGEIKNYTDVGGGKALTLDDVLSNFEAHLYKNLYHRLS